MIFQSVTQAVRKNVQERPRGMLLTGQALIPGHLNRRENSKNTPVHVQSVKQALAFRNFQASEGKREASEERTTRAVGEGSTPCSYFVRLKNEKKGPVLHRTPVNSSQALLKYPILCNTWAASNMYRPGCFKFTSTSSLVLQSTFIGDVALSDKYSLKKINK